MRTSFVALAICSASLLLFISGCASDPGAPPAGSSVASIKSDTPSAPAAPTAPTAPAPATANPPPAQATPPADDPLKPLAAVAPAPFEGDGWKLMFDGETLTGWKETPFAGHGEVEVRRGLLLLNMGDPFTGVSWTNAVVNMNYEIAFDAARITGSDFFCGLTMPVGENFCSLIVGGWGGSLVGISSLNGMDASENQTTKFMSFESKRWYRIRVRITDGRIEGWIDKEKIIDVLTEDMKISLRPGEIERSKPLGIACWQTSAAYREIRMRNVDKAADPPRKRPQF